MKISIILATYNWPQALNLVLENLAVALNKYQDIGYQDMEYRDIELIVADDGSDHATAKVIAKYKKIIPKLSHVWHEDKGFRKSMILNKAVAASTGEYLIFLDGDCIPFPDYIEQQLNLLETGYFIAGNRVLLSKAFTQEILNYPDIIKNIFTWNIFTWIRAKLRGRVNKVLVGIRLNKRAKWRYSRDTNWRYPKGCNFAVWRSDFMAVNGFDESFSGWGHEDADLFVRLLHAGVKIKDGRFALPVLHLWHSNAKRDNEAQNSTRLLERVNNSECKSAISGISQYISIAAALL